jgi:hypothetical protein
MIDRHKGSRVRGFKVSRFQGFKVSRKKLKKGLGWCQEEKLMSNRREKSLSMFQETTLEDLSGLALVRDDINCTNLLSSPDP